MTISDIKPGERVKDAHFTEDTLSVDLIDGRTIVVPLAWYPRLLYATPKQRANWQTLKPTFVGGNLTTERSRA